MHALTLAVLLTASPVTSAQPQPEHHRAWLGGEIGLSIAGTAHAVLGLLWLGSAAGTVSVFNGPSAADYRVVGWANAALGIAAIVGAVLMSYWRSYQ